MGNRWLPAVTVLLLLGGCGFENAPPPEPAKPPVRPAEKKPVPRTTDDFGLPLIIVIETPAVPKELLEPSPPIKGGAEGTPKP